MTENNDQERHVSGFISVTLSAFATDVEGRADADPSVLLEWPPDVFAFTSHVLQRTGIYRVVVSPVELGDGYYPPPNWQKDVQDDADRWLAYIGGATANDIVNDWVRLCKLCSSVTYEDLQRHDRGTDNAAGKELCRQLLRFHAIADQASRAFGIPASRADRPGVAAVRLLANLLISTSGSLARLSKHNGIVLPKLRTPQTGISLRTLSHHLTYHETEVSIVWRTVPWSNNIEEGLNILLIPWPHDFEARRFLPTEAHPTGRRLGRDRYFRYYNNLSVVPEAVLALLAKAKTETSRVHLLLFPELAMTTKELSELEYLLQSRSSTSHIPVILTGICGESDPSSTTELVCNRLVLSTYFAGTWYRLDQDKHHRWKLDQAQLRQYQLGGVLSPSKSWWEALPIPQRRLSFLVPNGWLAVAPLICEDLAQMHPTAELLRGVGPTLVAALLLDGPQLSKRWSARYATVLADDPGSSVVTLTSLGMVLRSRALDNEASSDQAVVGLWKDPSSGLKELSLGPEQRARSPHAAAIPGPSVPTAFDKNAVAYLLAASAIWREEYTADARGDGCSSAVLTFHHASPVRVDVPFGRERSVATAATTDNSVYKVAGKRDMEELTRFTYLVHAMLVEGDDSEELVSWITARPQPSDIARRIRPATSILDRTGKLIESSQREQKGDKPSDGQGDGPDFAYALQVLRSICRLRRELETRLPLAQSADQGVRDARRWRAYLEACQGWADAASEEAGEEVTTLDPDGKARIERLCVLSILSGVQEKLSLKRTEAMLQPDEEHLMSTIIAQCSDHDMIRPFAGRTTRGVASPVESMASGASAEGQVP